MAKVKVMMLSEVLSPDNKRNCLSAKRALGKCYECKSYGDQQGCRPYAMEEGDRKKCLLAKGLRKCEECPKSKKTKPCESRIVNKKYDELMEKKRVLREELKVNLLNIDAEVRGLDEDN
jgi:hypothetical protein